MILETSYTRDYMTSMFGNSDFASSTIVEHSHDSGSLAKYSRHENCDLAGNFNFDRVADGQYYLQSNILWVFRGSRGGQIERGGALLAKIHLSGGEHENVVLKKKF